MTVFAVLFCLGAFTALVGGMVFAANLSEGSLLDALDTYELSRDILQEAARNVDSAQVLLQEVDFINAADIETCRITYDLDLDPKPTLDAAVLQSEILEITVKRLQDLYDGLEGYASGKTLALQWTLRIAVLCFSSIWILTLVPAVVFTIRTSLSKVDAEVEVHEWRMNRSCAERWCTIGTVDSVMFINGILAAVLFLFAVLSLDLCVEPDQRMMTALSMSSKFNNATLVPNALDGTCRPFLLYKDGSLGAVELTQIPSTYSNTLREMCHVMVSCCMHV
jgi:hypothetical protein